MRLHRLTRRGIDRVDIAVEDDRVDEASSVCLEELVNSTKRNLRNERCVQRLDLWAGAGGLFHGIARFHVFVLAYVRNDVDIRQLEFNDQLSGLGQVCEPVPASESIGIATRVE